MTKAKSLLILAMFLWVCSCVEPFSASFDKNSIILTVDATLTDLDEQQTIKIFESTSYSGSTYANPVLKAKVELLVDNKDKIAFTEGTGGVYSLPASFRTKQGSTYQLFIQRADGRQYQSGKETLIKVADITKVYDEFVLKGVPRGNDYDPANYVYIDTPDPANEKNNYMWSWKLWEKQSVCTTCQNGRYQKTGTSKQPPGCREEKGYENTQFDYYCDGNCWDLFFNRDLNVFSDIYSNGNTITGKLVAKIPYYQVDGSLIEIKQQSISPEAYRYMKLIADQVQNSGGLVDTPPAALIGNVKNMSDDNEAVAGFFMVTSIKKVKYWISRNNAYNKAMPVGLLDHTIVLEPSGTGELDRPPLVPCIESNTRTKIKPEGWVDTVR